MKHLIKIGDREYAFEYSVEASLYGDFVEKLINFIDKYSLLYNGKKKITINKENVKESLRLASVEMPQLAFIGFYAGLLEHEKLTISEVKELYKEYLKEYSLMPHMVLEKIFTMAAEDNFPQLIGLTPGEKKKSDLSKKKGSGKQ